MPPASARAGPGSFVSLSNCRRPPPRIAVSNGSLSRTAWRRTPGCLSFRVCRTISCCSAPRPSSVHSACSRARAAADAGHLLQLAQGRTVLSLDQQPLGRVALPAVRAVERRDQAGRVELVEPRDRPRLRADRVDAVDAALVVPGPQVELLLPVLAGSTAGARSRARYMSATHSAPSGPVWIIVGRNQLSLDARNSRRLLVGGAAAA